MKFRFSFLIFFVLMGFNFLFAQTTNNNPDIWEYIENENMIGENKEPAHASFVSYINEENAKKNGAPTFSYVMNYAQFNWARSPKYRPHNFFELNYNTNFENWKFIKTPSNWEVEGYGIPIYVNHQYEFADYKAPISDEMEFTERIYPKYPGKVPHDYNPVGSYIFGFELDENWLDQQIFLHIGAMKSGGFVWINGKYVGYSQGSKLPTEFDVTDFIKEGTNNFSLQIYRWTDGSYLECQDFWRISGIERPIYFYAQPKLRIKDFTVLSTLDKAYENGKFSIDIEFENHLEIKKEFNVAYKLYDDDKLLLTRDQNITCASKSVTSTKFGATIKNIKQWNAEHPYLYRLQLIVSDLNDKLIETTFTNIGFRKVEIKNGLLLLNGKVITLKGVNAQEHDPTTGHVVDEKLMLKDILMWKQNNINAVRLSHYPRGSKFYELCDKYGIYVVDEANIESHGMYYGKHSLAKKESWENAHLDRMTRMVERDKNHASVIIWSMGNEAGNGINFYKGYNKIKELDIQKRPVQYERTYKDNNYSLFDMDKNTDIIVPQYPSPALFEKIGKAKTDRPFIPSEYAHSMGNSTGNFNDYWEIIEMYENLQGGFIWDWVDQSIWKTNSNGEKFYAYGGDYGIGYPSDNYFLNNGIVFPDRTPQPALHEVKKAHEFINFKSQGINRNNNLSVLIENLYDFTNLIFFNFTAQIKADGKVIKEFPIDELDVIPNTSKMIYIPLDDITFNANTEYFCEISARIKTRWGLLDKNFEVAHEQILLDEKYNLVPIENKIAEEIIVDENEKSIIISNELFSLTFVKTSGIISSFIYNNNEIIKNGNGPKPNFWRAVTDNDFGNKMHIKNIEWKRASLYHTVKSFDYKIKSKNEILVTIEFSLPGVNTTFNSSYTICGNGIIKISNTLNSSEYEADIPRVGMRMQIQNEFNNLTYFGKGPWENYRDRNTSAFVDLYKSKVADQYVPYIRPQENGYKTKVRWAAFTNEENNGLLIVSEKTNGFGFSALHMPNEDFDASTGLNYNPNDSTTSDAVNIRKHTTDIKEKDLVQLNIDYGQRGVGGDDSWYSKPQDKYLLQPNEKYKYGFYIIPVKNISEENLIDLYKKYNSN